ncbi:PHP domain-containing protein [bacterium]|nr:PHP domain-containing protein [bacterium]
MTRLFKADLHIHTCLSPCAQLEMTPRAIVRQAKLKGLDIIGISDHNSAENVVVTKKIGEKEGLVVIGGMEVTSREEVHILAFFADDEQLLKFQDIVYDNLTTGTNCTEVFGEQVVVNEIDEIIGFNQRLLIDATGLSINELVDKIHSFEGIAVASHIDREGFGIIGQLGFIPPDSGLDGFEISSKITLEEAKDRFHGRNSFITGSDAHNLLDIGKSFTQFLLELPTLKEIELALKGQGGRFLVDK